MLPSEPSAAAGCPSYRRGVPSTACGKPNTTAPGSPNGLSVGIDLVDVEEVAATLHSELGTRYLSRIYTSREVEDCRRGRQVDPARLAGRFAAKEAAMKALRVGDRPVSWREIEVHRAADGAPELVLARRGRGAGLRGGAVAVRAQPDARAHLCIGDRRGHRMTDSIREIIEAHGRLPVDVQSLPDDANLYQAGMTSHASVNLMLALEDRFDVEFPDEMLTRAAFESVGSIRAALTTLGVEDAS